MEHRYIIELLSDIDEKISRIETNMSDPLVVSDPQKIGELNREYKRLRELQRLRKEFEQLVAQIDDDEKMVNSDDEELASIAEDELPQLRAEAENLERKIVSLLAPPDPNEGRPVIVEIRAGTGGEEAALFAADLFKMYSRYAEEHRWKVEIIDANPTDIGGFKEIIFTIKGDDAYRLMRFESGVHRVQRIPITESGGRIHTSAASVAVLPEVPEEEVEISPDELKIDTYRASGAGGQHVNKVESAIRITHIPTGIVVTCQAERSQHKNRARAMQILRSKIASVMRSQKESQIDEKRRIQIGSGDRSEKIRTYNFPQNRITDHRIGYTAYNLQDVMQGKLDELFDALQSAWAEKMLEKS
ncbi:peptide chain release factor 1 [bacterium]|nr:MAG: peptide chain release factor 1 [bacterium]